MEERAWTGCYTSIDINYAASRGYRFYFWEAYHYNQSSYIFEKFFKFLAREKIKYSPVPQGYDLETYCKVINKKMNFTGLLALKPCDICPNAEKRLMSKLQQNGLLGKFIQRSTRTQIKTVHSQRDLLNLYQSNDDIQGFSIINDNLCIFRTVPSKEKTETNLRTNCIVGSFVTALGRKTLFQHLDSLLAISAKVFCTDTDSIMYSLKKGQKSGLDYSPTYGNFKAEYGSEILSFYALGVKNYCIKTKTETILKMKGISLRNEFVRKTVYDNYILLLEELLNDTFEPIQISQQRKRRCPSLTKVKNENVDYFLRSNVPKSRVLQKHDKYGFITIPFGYK